MASNAITLFVIYTDVILLIVSTATIAKALGYRKVANTLVYSTIYRKFYPLRSSDDLYDSRMEKYRRILIKKLKSRPSALVPRNVMEEGLQYHNVSLHDIVNASIDLSEKIEGKVVLTDSQIFVLNYLIFINQYNLLFKRLIPIDLEEFDIKKNCRKE